MRSIINTKLINKFIKENKLSKTKFSKLCRISLSTLNKILQNKDNLKINTIFKIARTMKIEAYQIFK